MTTAVVLVQRCMVILAIVLCYFHVRGESVDCEMYPFHHTCRGTMSRKRAMLPIVYGSGCDGSKGNLNCIRELEDRHRISYVPWSKSRLFLTLFDNGRNGVTITIGNLQLRRASPNKRDLSKDVKYTARHRQGSNDIGGRRPPLLENFLSELESADNDY